MQLKRKSHFMDRMSSKNTLPFLSTLSQLIWSRCFILYTFQTYWNGPYRNLNRWCHQIQARKVRGDYRGYLWASSVSPCWIWKKKKHLIQWSFFHYQISTELSSWSVNLLNFWSWYARQETELFEEMKQISAGVTPNLTIMVLDGAIGPFWFVFLTIPEQALVTCNACLR